MNLNHLTDNELLDHIIKYDEDPVRVRLATYMERVPGAIIDDLEFAGMDPTFCNFRSIVNHSEYHPGMYISHLETEVEYLQDRIGELHEELEKLKARTVLDLMEELKNQIRSAEFSAREAIRERDKAQENESLMKHKLDMWALLNR